MSAFDPKRTLLGSSVTFICGINESVGAIFGVRNHENRWTLSLWLRVIRSRSDPETVTICNCTDCQTMSGAPLRAVIITQPGTFVLRSGHVMEYRKTADSGAVRPQAFCPHCGTPIYSTSVGDDPKAYNVRVGALLQRNELVPRRQVFVRSQQAWVNDLSSNPEIREDGPAVRICTPSASGN